MNGHEIGIIIYPNSEIASELGVDAAESQTLLESSGSANQKLWDLTLSGSDQVVFRLNKSSLGGLAIASNNTETEFDAI